MALPWQIDGLIVILFNKVLLTIDNISFENRLFYEYVTLFLQINKLIVSITVTLKLYQTFKHRMTIQ